MPFKINYGTDGIYNTNVGMAIFNGAEKKTTFARKIQNEQVRQSARRLDLEQARLSLQESAQALDAKYKQQLQESQSRRDAFAQRKYEDDRAWKEKLYADAESRRGQLSPADLRKERNALMSERGTSAFNGQSLTDNQYIYIAGDGSKFVRDKSKESLSERQFAYNKERNEINDEKNQERIDLQKSNILKQEHNRLRAMSGELMGKDSSSENISDKIFGMHGKVKYYDSDNNLWLVKSSEAKQLEVMKREAEISRQKALHKLSSQLTEDEKGTLTPVEKKRYEILDDNVKDLRDDLAEFDENDYFLTKSNNESEKDFKKRESVHLGKRKNIVNKLKKAENSRKIFLDSKENKFKIKRIEVDMENIKKIAILQNYSKDAMKEVFKVLKSKTGTPEYDTYYQNIMQILQKRKK